MPEPVQINTLEIENVKRIKAVKIECDGQALTVVGGRNGQGKTSVLDAIAYALGGERYRPSNLKREGSLAHPEIKVTLNNGLIVERKGKNATLKVTDPQGRTGGQKLLNEFVSQFALNLPKFINSSPKEKANTLLQVIGIGEELAVLEAEEERIYNERLAFGRIADQKQKHADELEEYPDAPDTPVSASELIQEQQAILAKNGENQRIRDSAAQLSRDRDARLQDVSRLTKELADAEQALQKVNSDLATASKSAEQLQDESTAEIETKLEEIDAINVRVRANMDKAKASEDAVAHKAQYDEMTAKLEDVRAKKTALLDGVELPLPGLAVAKGELLFNGQPWDCMAGSDQLRAATAIVRRLNDACGFVLIDKLEQMDVKTLAEFGDWLTEQGLQAIATRVSDNGDECSIIIEDGFSVTDEGAKNFTVGEF
jgi:predicted ATP-dependent endonuclease of OLD family